MAGNSTFDSNWHMLTMTYDAAGGANNKKIYIDGALANQATATGNINASGAMMAFGARASADAYSTTNWSNFLTGKLDDIYFYNRALSAGDVSSLLTFTKATSPSLPADTLVAPVYPRFPDRTRVPAPALVNVKPPPV